MSDWWNNSPYTPQDENPYAPKEEPTEPQLPTEPQVPTEPQLPTEPQVPTEPQLPSPLDEGGWSRPTPLTPPTWTPSPMPMPQPPKKSNRSPKKGNTVVIVTVVILCVVCACLLGIIAVLLLENSANETSSASSDVSAASSEKFDGPEVSIQENSASNQVSGKAADGGLLTSEIVKNNLDSTVVINLYSNATIQYGNFSFGSSEEESLAGTASGIVLSEDGYLITNQHVVINEQTGEQFSRIEVQLYNGASYDAKVIGADEDTDLAVIKINANGLKPATFGSSESVELGDRIITIGNSGGLEWSVSEGILSGKKRDVYDKTGYDIQCLQIDAAINPGNSGGPLINNKGEVIGINSAKIVYDGIENLGFSIPIDEAKKIIDDLVKNGHVTGRVGLGVTGYTITQIGYEGFMIYSIEKGSSLADTKVEVYDIITAVDGQKVTSRTELRSMLAKHKPGDRVTLTLKRITDQRTGETIELKETITLKELTD